MQSSAKLNRGVGSRRKGVAVGQSTLEPLRFELDGQDAAPPGGVRRGRRPFAIGMTAGGLLGLVFGAYAVSLRWPATTHVVVALGLGGVILAALVYAWLRRSASSRANGQPSRPPGRELVADSKGLYLQAPERQDRLLFVLDESLGISLLSNRARDRLILALTSSNQVLYVGSKHLGDDERERYLTLLSRATTIPEDDAVLEATGSDGLPLQLHVRDLESLLTHLLRVDPRALDRCFLSDTSGTPVVLDGSALQIGRHVFDLSSPLEWHAFLFQEPVGPVSGPNDWECSAPPMGGVMVYQATWVRQGSREAVLVSVLASIAANHVPSDLFAGHAPQVQSALLRDLRLMQAAPDAPPPHDLRIGIERCYMVRLRAALDRAPRATHRSHLRSSP